MKKIFSLVIVLVMALACCLAACKPEVADNTKFYDDITKTCKLTKSYEGKSFIADGIGKATVADYTDGDTTRFTLIADGDDNGRSVVIRYHSIDTPESTGSVEKWGKAASNFVMNQLKKATEVVLEATAVPAEVDSYGSRYLGYVWYKTADHDFQNLNLEVVENGFSENKGQDTSKFPYNDYFKQANEFAKSIELRLYSKLADPLYSTTPVEMPLKEIIADLNKGEDSELYSVENNSGAKVKFDACLTSLEISTSGTYTFTATVYDPATGENSTIDVYAQYQSSNESKMEIGHLYTIIGTVDVHGSSFQIKGLTYSSRYNQPGYTKVKQANYYLAFDNSIKYVDNYASTLYTNATVTSSKVENGVLTIVATAKQRTSDGTQDEEKTFTFKVKVSDDYVNDKYVEGAKFSVRGYQYTADSNVIDICKYSDLTLKSN